MSTDHAEQACIHLAHARNQSDADNDEFAHLGYAQAHATLALAAEQRAANIIAAYVAAGFGVSLVERNDPEVVAWISEYLTAAIRPIEEPTP